MANILGDFGKIAYFCSIKQKGMEMNHHVLNPNSSSAATKKFWPELKRLSNRDKLNLIVLLSSSMTQSEEVEPPKAHKGWASRFAGVWQDSRSAEEIVADIRAARTDNTFDTQRWD